MKFFANYEFLQPGYLWFLLLIPAVLAWKYFIAKRDSAAVVYPGTAEIFGGIKSLRMRLAFLPSLLRYLAITAVIIAIRVRFLIHRERISIRRVLILYWSWIYQAVCLPRILNQTGLRRQRT